jgi:phage tail-like protein
MREDALNYRHFNRDGLWLDFTWSGLDLDANGTLRFHSLPSVSPEVDLPLAPSAVSRTLALAPDGSIIATDPVNGGLVLVDACSGEAEPIPLSPPIAHAAAILVSAAHRAVFVADADSGQVVAFDWTTWTEMLVWSGFTQPVALAAETAGNVFVADASSGRIDKLSPSGDVLPFGDTVQATGKIVRPVALALVGDRLSVLDSTNRAVIAFDTDGNFLADVAQNLTAPSAIAAFTDVVYVADSGVIDVFKRSGTGWELAGSVAGYSGPVAAMIVDVKGALLVDAGLSKPLYRCSPDSAFAREGLMWSRALSASDRIVKWHSLQALAEQPSGTLFQWAFYSSNDAADPPVYPDAADAFPAPWRKPGPAVTDFYLGDEARYLWIGVRWLGDGIATPALFQIRGEFDHIGYLTALPEIYREPPGPDVDFLTRFLALFEGGFETVEREIEGTIALLDADAAPVEDLSWLASFLELPLPADASVSRQRDLIAHAFTRSAQRGTIAAMQQAILDETGIRTVIEEPIQQSVPWNLPSSPTCPPGSPTFGGLLGFDTFLAAAEPQGAVVGTTATLDRSHLIDDDQYGAPLFDDIAHQFTVRVYRSDAVCATAFAELQAVVEREKPTHTMSQICIVEPRMRVGFQSTLGIDTVLNGPATPTRLGEGALILAGDPAGRLDISTAVGVTTRL